MRWLLALVLIPATGGALDRDAYEQHVRPVLLRAGCAAAACHGSGLVPFVVTPEPGLARARHEFEGVAAHVVPDSPAKSALLTKALGEAHEGGRTLAADGCEAGLLADWIDGKPPRACVPPRAPVRTPGRPAPPLPPEASVLLRGCATAACHGGPARPLLLDPARPGAARVAAESLWRFGHSLEPGASRLLRALTGGGGHPVVLRDADDPEYRRLAAWLMDEAVPLRGGPSREAFRKHVQPVLERRGCATSTCHGDAEASFLLRAGEARSDDNFLRTLSRVSSGLLLSKATNATAHGGGLRLGGEDDCAARVVRAWVAGRKPPTCKAPPRPDRETFERVVLPGFDALTCTNCHEDGTGGWWSFSAPTPAEVTRAYESTLQHADLDFPPVSSVLQRVREKCLQSQMVAWLSRRPVPACRVDLANFVGTFPTVDVTAP